MALGAAPKALLPKPVDAGAPNVLVVVVLPNGLFAADPNETPPPPPKTLPVEGDGVVEPKADAPLPKPLVAPLPKADVAG
jgi:hypothetical protein